MNRHLDHVRGSPGLLALSLALLAANLLVAVRVDATSAAISPVARYLIADRAQEVALARSAAPASISQRATVLVLGAHGYITAARGRNGFVCLVARSWDNTVRVKATVFWNPSFRAPYCFNAAAARTVLTRYLMRTQWIVNGASERQVGERDRAAWAAGKLQAPAAGAMSYMMSKGGAGIGGAPGAWRPHLMFYFPRARTPNWGANLRGSPVIGDSHEDIGVFYIPVPEWSDGSPAVDRR